MWGSGCHLLLDGIAGGLRTFLVVYCFSSVEFCECFGVYAAVFYVSFYVCVATSLVGHYSEEGGTSTSWRTQNKEHLPINQRIDSMYLSGPNTACKVLEDIEFCALFLSEQ